MLFVSRARHAVGALTKAGAATRTLASLPDQGPEVVSGLQPSKVEAPTRAQNSDFARPRENRDLHAIAAPPYEQHGGARRRRGNLACTRLTARCTRRPRTS